MSEPSGNGPTSHELNERISDIREWLVRIDTKVDFMTDVRRTAEDADARSKKNEDSIDGLKKFLMWATGLLTTAVITLAGAVITVLF